MSAEPIDVLVVGGGPCGLAAAYAAAKRGLDVMLVESSATLGGMAASFSIGGQSVDYGSHRLHPSMSPRVRALIDELLGSDLQVRQRNGRLRVRGRWVAFPLRPMDMARSLPPSFVLDSVRDVATKPLRTTEGRSYADVVVGGLGPTALQDFHGPMAEKLWGLPPEQLAAELAHKRISVKSASKLAKVLARRSSDRTFLYPRLGYGQIVSRLAEGASARGAALVTDTEALAVARDSNGAATTVSLSNGTTSRAKRVLWTAPVGPLASAIGVPDPTRYSGPPMRGLVLAYLVVDTNRYSSFDAHYVADVDVAFSRLSEPRNYRTGPDPSGRTVLCAEIPATPGDDVWDASDDELALLVTEGMDRCEMPKVDPVEVQVRRLPSVYPVIEVDEPTTPRPEGGDFEPHGVTVLGRQGLAVADNLHHVLDMALSAVDCIGAGGAWDATRWTEQLRRFRDFVVED